MSHKFVALKDRKQNVLNLATAMLTPDDLEIPLVAAAEPSQLTLFWWDKGSSMWRSFSRNHAPIPNSARRMTALENQNWCHRVGLTASHERVFLIYRRCLQDEDGFTIPHQREPLLYMDVFEWDTTHERLNRITDDAPLKIPLEDLGHDRVGYYLWCGVDADTNKLIIIFQSIKIVTAYDHVPGSGFEMEFGEIPRDRLFPVDPDIPRGPGGDVGPRPDPVWMRRSSPFFMPFIGGWDPEFDDTVGVFVPHTELDYGHLVMTETRDVNLILLSIDARDDFENSTHWSQIRVDEGGYDFDAVIENERVQLIYRRTPYALSYNDPARISHWISELQEIALPLGPEGAGYAPLFYREIRLDTLAIDEDCSLKLPGGEHPQLHGMDPTTTLPLITLDRISDGTIVINPPTMVTRTITYGTRIEEVEKVLLLPCQETYSNVSLFTTDGTIYPLNIIEGSFRPILNEISVNTFYLATFDGYRPLYSVIDSALARKRIFDFLLRIGIGDRLGNVPLSGYLGIVRFHALSNLPPTLQGIVDINHRQLVDRNGLGANGEEFPRGGENRQFIPFVQSQSEIENTIGGALVVDRPTPPLTLLAYTDLGDRGLRVLYEGAGIGVDGDVTITKPPTIATDDISGPGVGEDIRITIPGIGWIASALPSYPLTMSNSENPGIYTGDSNEDPGSLGSGFQILLDTLIMGGRGLAELSGSTFPQPEEDTSVKLTEALIQLITTQLSSPEEGISASWGSGDPLPVMTISPQRQWVGGDITLGGAGSIGSHYSIKDHQFTVRGPLDEDENGPVAHNEHGRIIHFSLDTVGEYEAELLVSNLNGESHYSNEYPCNIDDAPSPPTSLRAAFLPGPTLGIQIFWNTPVYNGGSPIASYKVFRQETGSTTNPLEIGEVEGQHWLVDDSASLEVDKQYTYHVLAINTASNEGQPSAPIRAYVGIGSTYPHTIESEHQGNRIRLTWHPSSDIDPQLIKGYKVYRKTDSDLKYAPVLDELVSHSPFTDEEINRGRTYSYHVATVFRNGTVDQESTWSPPTIASPPSDAPPRNLSALKTPQGISMTWLPPSYNNEGIAGYRVYRALYGSNIFSEITDPSSNPITNQPFVDTSAQTGERYSYAVVAVNGIEQTNTVQGRFGVDSLWDNLWETHEQINVDERFEVRDADITMGKYRLEYRLKSGRRESLTIITLREWQTKFKFGNWRIDYCFDIGFESERIVVRDDFMEDKVNVEKIKVNLRYSRPFTMGVLMSDVHEKDPSRANPSNSDTDEELPSTVETVAETHPTDGSTVMLPEALAAKPIGPTEFGVSEVHVDISLTKFARIALNLYSLLIFFGLFVLANELLILGGGGIIDPGLGALLATIGTVALTIFINIRAEPAIEERIESGIKEQLEDSDFKGNLDGTPLMWYAGEGLAESIAIKVLQDDQIDILPDLHGRNRFREQFWQMVAIDPGKCVVWVRK